MAKVETVKVKDSSERGYKIINKDEYEEKKDDYTLHRERVVVEDEPDDDESDDESGEDGEGAE